MLLNVVKLFKLSVNLSSNCSLGDSEGSSDSMTRNLPVCRSGGGGRSYWFVRPSRVKTVQNRVTISPLSVLNRVFLWTGYLEQGVD